MNKTVTAVLAISVLAVNVAGATSNNTVGGTDNTISTNSTSSAVWGFQNNIDANNALAFGTNNSVTGENGFAGGNDAKAWWNTPSPLATRRELQPMIAWLSVMVRSYLVNLVWPLAVPIM